MTEPINGDRAKLIQKLLAKAEAQGTTPEERESFMAKASQLMIKWGVDDAMLAASGRIATEKIVQVMITSDAPKSYSYEMTLVGVKVANALGCRGLLQRTRDGRTNLLVVGFESDVDRVRQMFQSLALQCTLELGPWFRYWLANDSFATYANGTDKFNAKRSFIRGFADGVATKMRRAKEEVLKTATPGTDLVLVDRGKKVDEYIDSSMSLGKARGRRYQTDGHGAGHQAGLRADVGGGAVGGSRTQIGG